MVETNAELLMTATITEWLVEDKTKMWIGNLVMQLPKVQFKINVV